MELSGKLHTHSVLPPPRRGTPIPTEKEAGWTPEPMWTVWSREKSLVPTGIPTPDLLARRLPHTAKVGGRMFCKVAHATSV